MASSRDFPSSSQIIRDSIADIVEGKRAYTFHLAIAIFVLAAVATVPAAFTAMKVREIRVSNKMMDKTGRAC